MRELECNKIYGRLNNSDCEISAVVGKGALISRPI